MFSDMSPTVNETEKKDKRILGTLPYSSLPSPNPEFLIEHFALLLVTHHCIHMGYEDASYPILPDKSP